jgi:hypothetical protein
LYTGKLKDNAEGKSVSGTIDVASAVSHKPSAGLETGLSLQYDLAKRIKLKGGVQLNYTSYNADAYETNHPVATTITMNASDGNSIYEQSRLSNYSNAFGLLAISLHNETYQISLPVGADIKLAIFRKHFVVCRCFYSTNFYRVRQVLHHLFRQAQLCAGRFFA